MAQYGATVNDSVVYNEPADFVYQVHRDFREHYALTPDTNAMWEPDTSLFTIWFGINELVFSACARSQVLLTFDRPQYSA